MNPAGKNSDTIVLLAALLVLALAAGCLGYEKSRVISGVEITSNGAEEIVPGVTTRSDIMMWYAYRGLNLPRWRWDRAIAFAWQTTGGVNFGVTGQGSQLGPHVNAPRISPQLERAFCVRFDSMDRVISYGFFQGQDAEQLKENIEKWLQESARKDHS